MKTSIKIMAIGALLSCVACGAKKSTQSKMGETQQEMSAEATDETQDEMAMNDSDERSDSGMEESNVSTQANSSESGGDTNIEPPSATENMNYLEMYSELEMTDTQIQDFETGLRNFYTQQKNTASGEMMGTLADERERQLKEILSEDQYSAYIAWKTDN